ncbi:nitronate monooxygenase [Donghicola sp.]|uniref:NAD(P)H-dependent flavin oxidoreductase n=1 Tax=Donghicola sp. TaxID=1929294 RepID=UPI0025FC9FBB|nr:nitronate monooxygenase [Donghicola sp.]MCT4578849.1 nitronate monooxygenase [Donghicola sp.]
MLRQAKQRAQTFCDDYGLDLPILMAPMAGACPPALAAAVMKAGGMGACGALLMGPEAVAQWAADVRTTQAGPFQLNLWVPDQKPARDRAHETRVADFLAQWGPRPSEISADIPVSFADQCNALIEARPAVVSSIMGIFPPEVVAQLKAKGIRWFATATTVAEALAAEEAGADAIVAQGSEAGGHRGAFDAQNAAAQTIGLVSLVPAICDAVKVPVIATGGIADARGVLAALALGASAVQIGTALLRTPEAAIPASWADAIGRARPEDTAVTRAFSGRLGRSLRTDYVTAAEAADAPDPLPYPLQRSATGPMRAAGTQDNDIARLQAWAGQSAALAQAAPAEDVVRNLWAEVKATLG